MAIDDLQRTIMRISVFDGALSLAALGLAFAMVMGVLEGASVFAVIAAIGAFAVCVILLDPLFTGLPRREANDLRRRIRPRWFSVIYLAMFALYAVISFPGADALTGIKINIGVAVCAMIGISNLPVAIYNLANPAWSAKPAAVDPG